MTKKKADILVFSPHPVDAEFGVAGTVAKRVLSTNVFFVIFRLLEQGGGSGDSNS